MNQKRSGFRIGLVGLCIAVVGVISGFSGFYFELRPLALIAFAITVIGVAIGFIGILYGWATQGRKAIGGSAEAARDLRNKIRTFGK